jgi:hypothetical protein
MDGYSARRLLHLLLHLAALGLFFVGLATGADGGLVMRVAKFAYALVAVVQYDVARHGVSVPAVRILLSSPPVVTMLLFDGGKPPGGAVLGACLVAQGLCVTIIYAAVWRARAAAPGAPPSDHTRDRRTGGPSGGAW